MTSVIRVGPLMPQLSTELDSHYQAAVLQDLTQRSWDGFAEHCGILEGLTVAVTSGRTGIPNWLMDRLPHLRAIVNFGVGYDATDVAAAQERGIAIANTPDVLTECVADTALGLVISTLRRLPSADRFLRAGQWTQQRSFPLTSKVSGKRFGILGLGRIGRATATRLQGFSSEIGYHNRRERKDVPYTYYSSPQALAEASDVLVVTAPGGPSSQGLVDRAVLQALGPGGFLVNVGRGSVVDEMALVDALEAGEIAGAGLDTYAEEPAVPQALLNRDDVVLLPHLASGTQETREAMSDLVLRNVQQFLKNGELVTPVSS